MKYSVNSSCPCGTGNKYKKCCQPFHKGKLPKTSLELMRSRYTAYYLSLAQYIIKTTHPKNTDYKTNFSLWKAEILEFSQNYSFNKLTILETILEENISYVTFKAELTYLQSDASFTEKSKFEKILGQWLYLSGEQR